MSFITQGQTVSQVHPRIEAISCDSNRWKMLPPVIWLCTASHGSLQHVFLLPTFFFFPFFIFLEDTVKIFPAQSEIHSLHWNTAAAALMVFSSEGVKWWPTYEKSLVLEKSLLREFYDLCLVFVFCSIQAGKEGDSFISADTRSAQLLCPNTSISC